MPAVAVVQTAFIGDVILATPLFAAARHALPGERVVGVVRKGCENIIENNPNVDDIIVWDKRGADGGFGGIFRIAGAIRHCGVHTALIPHRSLRTALALRISGAQVRVGFAKGGGSLMHTVRVPYRKGIHEVERNLMLAAALGWQSDGYVPAVYPDGSDREAVDRVLMGIGEFCVLAPGSVWPTKMWPAEYYIRIGAALAGRGMGVVVNGGTTDTGVCSEVAKGVPGAVDTCGNLTLRQSAELYRRSIFLLTGDTAPQHLAAAVGARVFALFGPTVRDFGFWPYTERGTVIEESLECRPCGVHGHTSCPLGTHACMKLLSPETLLGVIDGAIG